MRVCIAQNVSLSDHLALSTYLRSISKYLADEKNMELIILPLKGTNIPNDISNNIEIHEIPGGLYSLKGNIQYSFNLYKKLNEISKEKPIDIIHCLYPNSSVIGAALFKRNSPGTRIIYDIRSPWIEMSVERGSIPMYAAPIYSKIAYFAESFLYKYVDKYIFITEGLKRFYQSKIKLDSKPFEIIPSGVDLNLFTRMNPKIIRDKYNLKDDDLLLGYVGGIARMRELDFVLKAFKKLVVVDERYKLMFVGEGDNKNHLEAIAKELHIQSKVIFTGKVPYEQVPYYMSAFDAGICHLPDKLVYRYSFPMKVLEYLACETPAFVSDIEAHREIAMKIKSVDLYENIPSFIDNIRNTSYKYDKKIESYSWNSICKDIKMAWESTI